MSHTHTYTHREGGKEGWYLGMGKKNKKEFMKIDNKPRVCTMEQ
jgi:hypothetical protein